MNYLSQALKHINISIKNPIDNQTFIDCIKLKNKDNKWKYHIVSFFWETNISVVHSIVNSEIFTFEELYNAYLFWDGREAEYTSTPDSIKEMYFLESGRGKELDNPERRFGRGWWNV